MSEGTPAGSDLFSVVSATAVAFLCLFLWDPDEWWSYRYCDCD